MRIFLLFKKPVKKMTGEIKKILLCVYLIDYIYIYIYSVYLIDYIYIYIYSVYQYYIYIYLYI